MDRFIEEHGLEETKGRLKIIASLESPLSLLNLKEVSFEARIDDRRDEADRDARRADCYFFQAYRLTSRESTSSLYLCYSLADDPFLLYSSPPRITVLPPTSSAPNLAWRCSSLARLSLHTPRRMD